MRAYLVGLSLFLAWSSCVHDPLFEAVDNPKPCDTSIVNFREKVLPLFQSRCAMEGCHGGTNVQKGVKLDSYASIVSTGGLNIGNPAKSKIIEKGIWHEKPERRMPPSPLPPLTGEQVDAILLWIQQGAKDTGCVSIPCDTSNVLYRNQVSSILNQACVGCHHLSNPSGNVDLSTYAGSKAAALSGRLIGAIEHKPGYIPMPQGGGKISDCHIATLKKWVNLGLPE